MLVASRIVAIFMAIISFFSSFGFLELSQNKMLYDVQYGEYTRQVVDISMPKGYKKQQGAILFIHGGGWVAGNKSGFTNRAIGVSEKYGCITASMNYRYASDKVDCNDMLDDIDLAIEKIKDTAAANGAELKRVMLVGFSAGGHLAMLYAYTRKSTAALKVCAVASYSGPTDLSSRKFIEKNALGSEELMRGIVSDLIGQTVTKKNFESKKDKLLEISPVKHVSSSCVPTLLVQGEKDKIVYPSDTRVFVDKLKAKGVTYKYFELEGAGHQLDEDEAMLEESNEAFGSYVKKYLK